LRVTLLIHGANGDLHEQRVSLTGRHADFVFDLAARPLRLDLDPRFDLFRRLAPGETPVTLSALFGAEDGLILLPTGAEDRLAAGYRALAEAWARGSPGWKLVRDDQLDALPQDRPVWLLGWENKFISLLAEQAGPYRLNPQERRFQTVGQGTGGTGESIALVTDKGRRPVGLVAAGNPEAIPGLARKLPHYGKYSYLVFAGVEPANRIKGQWPGGDSRLSVRFTDERPSLAIPPLPPLMSAMTVD